MYINQLSLKLITDLVNTLLGSQYMECAKRSILSSTSYHRHGPNPQAELLRPKSEENLKSHNCPLDMSRLWYQQTQCKDVRQISSWKKQGDKKSKTNFSGHLSVLVSSPCHSAPPSKAQLQHQSHFSESTSSTGHC